MKKMIAGVALCVASTWAMALQPYVRGVPVAGGDLTQAMQAVEQKLGAAGFSLLGRDTPRTLPGYGVVVVSDDPSVSTNT